MKVSIVAALVALAGLVPSARATSAWLVDVTYSNPGGYIAKPGDKAFVHVWAQFDDNLYAFAGGALSVFTDDTYGSWSDIHTDLIGPGTSDGVADGGDVTGIDAYQLLFPPLILVDTSNPIMAWHGTFTTSDLSFGTVNLFTETTQFDVYLNHEPSIDSFLDELSEGAAGIIIIPSPGAGGVLAIVALRAGKRSRPLAAFRTETRLAPSSSRGRRG